MDDKIFTLIDSIEPKDGDGDDGWEYNDVDIRIMALHLSITEQNSYQRRATEDASLDWGDILSRGEDYYNFIKGDFYEGVQ